MNIKFKVRFEDAKLVIGANPSKLSEEVAVRLSTTKLVSKVSHFATEVEVGHELTEMCKDSCVM
jgi:hypothetical protein